MKHLLLTVAAAELALHIRALAKSTLDAMDQAPYHDTMCIAAVEPKTANEARKKAGKPLLTLNYVVAASAP